MIALALALSLQPPMLLRIEQPSVVYAPDGQRISLPAGTELDLCAHDGALLVAGQRSDEITVLDLDDRTGAPGRVRHRTAAPAPTHLLLAR